MRREETPVFTHEEDQEIPSSSVLNALVDVTTKGVSAPRKPAAKEKDIVGDFDLDGYLKQQGLQILEADPGSRKLVVKTPDGQEGDFDVDSLLKSYGLNEPGKVAVKFNAPDSPVQSSPVDFVDRMKMGFGNTKGNIGYLEKEFGKGNVQFNPDHGLVVNTKGLWHAVDPNLLGPGDAWDKTKRIASSLGGFRGNKDLAGDIAELGPELLNTVLVGGATAAATVMSGGAATIPAALAAGGVSGAIRTRLGRLVGTYEATEEEHAADIALEMLFSAGGQGVAMAAKPAMGAFVNAAKNAGKNLSAGSRSAFVKVFGGLTKAGDEATEYMLDNAPRLGATVAKYANGAKDVSAAVSNAAQDKVSTLTQFLDDSAKALPRKYGELLDDVVKNSGKKNLAVDYKTMIDDTFKTLEVEGLGSVDKATGQFKLHGEDNLAELLSAAGDGSVTVDPSEARLIKQLLRSLKAASNTPQQNGQAAAKSLRKFEQILNGVSESAYSKASQPTKMIIGKVKAAYKNSVGDQFEKAGLREEYTNLSRLYTQYGDAVSSARQYLSGNEAGIETLAKQLVSAPGQRVTQKALRDTLVDLTGQQGIDHLDKFSLLHATEKFLPQAPSLGLIQAMALGMTVAGPGTGKVLGGMAIAGSMPRTVMNATRVAQKTVSPVTTGLKTLGQAVDLMKSLPKGRVKELLANDQLFMQLVRPAITAPMMESQIKETLIQKAGANRGQ